MPLIENNRVINEAMPDNVTSGNYASDWARKIGTERLNADVYNLPDADANTASPVSVNENSNLTQEQKNLNAVLSAATNGMKQSYPLNTTKNSDIIEESLNGGTDNGRERLLRDGSQRFGGEEQNSQIQVGGVSQDYGRIPGITQESAGRNRIEPDLRNQGNNRGLTPSEERSLEGTVVTNDDGTPKAVYHFTENMDFDTFGEGDIGFHFGNEAQSLKRASDLKQTGRTIKAFLAIKNPIRIPMDIMSWQAAHVALKLQSEDYITEAQYNAIHDLQVKSGGTYNTPAAQELRRILTDKGYDGIVYDNHFEGDGESYIAFYPEQVIILDDGKGNTGATSDTEVASFVPENEQSEVFESGEENNTPETQTPASEEFSEDFEEKRPVFTEPNPREIAREASREEKIASLLGETMSIRQRQANAIADKFGLKIRWTDKVPLGTFNPKTNTISMNPNTTLSEAYMVIFKHEWIHYLENRKEYKAFKEYLFEDSVAFEDYIRGCLAKQNGEAFNGSREEAIERYTEIIFERRKNAKEIPPHIREGYTTEKIEREIVADFCAEVLIGADNIEESERALNEIAQTHRNFIQRIIDFISDWIDKIRGEAQNRSIREDLEYLNARLARVYDSKAQKNTAKDGDVKYSLNRNAPTELHKALYDINYRNEVLLRDETPAILLSQKGVNNLPMVMNASHIRENVFTEEEARNLGLKVNENTHYHGIGEEYFLQIIDSLDNVKEAYRGTKNANMPSRREKYFLLVTEFKDNEGNTINVPVYIEEGAICNNVYLTSNKFATVFGRNDFRKYINEQVRKQNLVRIKNKNNAYSEGGVPLTPAYESIVLNDSITDNEPTVNSNYMQESENNSDEIFAISKFDFAGEMQTLNDKLKGGQITAEEFIKEANKISKREIVVSDKLRAAIDETRKAKNKATQKLSRIEKTVIRQREQLAKRRQEVFEDVYALREERATRQMWRQGDGSLVSR